MEDDQEALNKPIAKYDEELRKKIAQDGADAFKYMVDSLDKTFDKLENRALYSQTFGRATRSGKSFAIAVAAAFMQVEIDKARSNSVQTTKIWFDETKDLKDVQRKLSTPVAVNLPVKTNSRNPMNASGAETWKRKNRR